MKKILLSITILFTILTSTAHAAMWQLINQQFNVNMWYCTYQLQGSNPPIQTTIQSRSPCQPFVMQ